MDPDPPEIELAFVALIPAAGRSKRMRTPKAWLTLQGRSLLQTIITAAVDGGAHAVVVVAGTDEDDDDGDLVTRIDVATEIETRKARLSVAIGEPDGTPIDSIRRGLELVGDGLDVLLWPVDYPFGSSALVFGLVSALNADPKRIAVPVLGDKRCHPILLGAHVARELASSAADEGAHAVVRADASRIVEVAATDHRLLRDLSTPDDARAVGIVVSSG